MKVKQSSYVMSGDSFFEPAIPIFVNRAHETFDLHTHSHEFVEITYVSQGSGVHYIGDEAISVEHGTLFFIPVGHSHVFRPRTTNQDRPLIVYNCLFQKEYLTELQAAFHQASDIFSFFTEEHLQWFSVKDTSGAYHVMFQEMHSEFSAKAPGYLAVLAALIIRILTGMYRQRMQISTPDGDRPQWTTVDEALAFIHCNYANGIKLSELAARAALSERQFSRIFRHQTGMNFTDYMQTIRMDAACRLLSGTRRSVSEIATESGYADLKFFHRLFKNKIGVTPRQYREAMTAKK